MLRAVRDPWLGGGRKLAAPSQGKGGGVSRGALPAGTAASSPLDGPFEVRRDDVPPLPVLDHCMVPNLHSGAIARCAEHRDPGLEGGDGEPI